MPIRQIHSCPECNSTELKSQLIATASHDSNYQWVVEQPDPDDLIALIESAGTNIFCDTCGWDGTWGETIVHAFTATDGLQYDQGAGYEDPRPCFQAIQTTVTDDVLKQYKVGTVFTWLGRNTTPDDERRIIFMYEQSCRWWTTNPQHTEQFNWHNGTVMMYVLAPAGASMYSNTPITIITAKELIDAIARGGAIIVKKEKIEHFGDPLLDEMAGEIATEPPSSVII